MCIRDRIYAVNKNKAVAMFHIGSEDLSEGLAIVGAVSYTHLIHLMLREFQDM